MSSDRGTFLSRFLKLFPLVLLATVCLADSLIYMRVERSVIDKRLQPVPASQPDRVATLRAQFKAAGCATDMIQEQQVPNEEFPNLVCMVPGPDPGAIVIGTRLDSKAHNDEAVVDWGGPVMLPLLAESMISAPHHQTFIFVAFAGHDHGFAGANYFLKQLNDDQRAQIQAMIQIDQVGRTPATYAYPSAESARVASVGSRRPVVMDAAQKPTTLSKVLPLAANSLKLSEAPKYNGDVGATEARVFDEAKIPSIVIHSPSYTTISTPGKNEPVRLSRTDLDSKTYSDTYNLLCVYLLYLDKVYFLTNSKAAQTQVAQANPSPAESNAAAPAPAATGAPPAGESSSNPQAASRQLAGTRPPPVAEGNPANPVFRTTTRLVQVDVVVTDKQGKPISGLTASDFTVLQDGKPQKVHVFEPHVAATDGNAANGPAAAPQAPKLPPNTYSNHPNAATADSWTIVLFDLLNTATTDQEYARKQLLDMLHTIPKGQPVALYLLTSKLVMVQAFTDDPETLIKSAENLNPRRSHVLTTEVERQHQEGQISYQAAQLTSSAPSSVTPDNNAIVSEMTEDMQQIQKDLEGFQISDRAQFTLAAFEALSRAVSGYPGRKNLIWLSSAFPVQLMADAKNTGQPWRNSASFRTLLSDASAMLAKSRVAVYPVDVRGLQGRGADVSNSAMEVGAYTSGQNSQEYGNLIGTQTATFNDERFTMKEVAEQTGGEAFVGTNDLKRAMQRSMTDGSTYYTLAYSPDKVDPQTAYHHIEVKVAHPDVKLSYRRGYYSSPEKATSAETGLAGLRGALQPGMPPSTMLFMTASVVPPDATHKNVRIQYVINPNGVTFADVADQRKRIVVDCMAVAYNQDGREVGHASDTMDGTIKAAAYETVMSNGIPAQQEMSLPPGAYILRLGVMDRPSQQIGTLAVQLVIPETTAAKN